MAQAAPTSQLVAPWSGLGVTLCVANALAFNESTWCATNGAACLQTSYAFLAA